MLCRNCSSIIELSPLPQKRCPHCDGVRFVQHPDAAQLSIAHIDCDAFYASVEKRDNPSIRGKPVIIGGGKRGVVTTACYIARIKGVRSAMPMFQALKKCPNAVVISPNMEKYGQVGREIREHFKRLTPLVEPLSIDEAFLDISPLVAEGQHATQALNRLAEQISDSIGITISIGLSHNKLLAKIASDLDKPNGFSIIGFKDGEKFLSDKPVKILWGVGPATAKTLNASGIKTVGQLRALPLEILLQRFGKFGRQLYHFSRGEDARKVTHDRGQAKTVSTETTFSENLSQLDDLSIILNDLSKQLAIRLKRKELAGRTITLKLKTADFNLLTRSKTLAWPLTTAREFKEAALPLLSAEVTGQQFRLMGLGVSRFEPSSGS